MKETKRREYTKTKPVNLDFITDDLPEAGFITSCSPFDPEPSIKVENGLVVEMDSKPRSEFDSIDLFIADHGIDTDVCEKAMAMNDLDVARMLVDINVPKDDITRLAVGMTPAKLMRVVSELNIVEIMMAQMKMRARKSTANQGHVTNMKDNPVLMAADAAEAALRGFAEEETTCVVGRYAPFNAIALLVGSQVGRPGVITQCSMEEAVELQLGMRGLTSYAETISVYGTEGVFTDGDDTPWSKAFLASAYASRGIKMRSSSGSGAELLMGDTEQKSLLYLEARCIWITKASGIQGTQNGAIDGLALSSSVKGGLRMVCAENLIASILGLEVAAGNDTWFTSSDIRRTAKFITAMLPGADFATSGYSTTPNSDNVFAGSNADSDDYDDIYNIQRDYLVDAGLTPVKEQDVIRVRKRAATAMQVIFKALGFAAVTDEEIEAATYAYNSDDMPDRNAQDDMRCAQLVMSEKITGADIALILKENGFDEEAEAILELNLQRVSGDYLQTSAIFDREFSTFSAVNDRNDYTGPGTGYVLGEKRISEISDLQNIVSPEEVLEQSRDCRRQIRICETGPASEGKVRDEVVICVSPSFGTSQKKTMGGVDHMDILDELAAGLEEQGISARFVKCYESADLGVIGSIGSRLSGSGISIGVQSKGTTVIHQKDLSPLSNLELFSQGPQLTAEIFRNIGKSAGRYAIGDIPTPIESEVNPQTRRYLVRSAMLHRDDMEQVEHGKAPVEFTYEEVE